MNLNQYLKSGEFVDSDHYAVIEYAEEVTKNVTSNKNKIQALYYAIRDGFRYDPYRLDLSREGMKASDLVKRDYGYCIEKSNLFAASCRVLGIPSRLGFANVQNHIGTSKLEEVLKTNTLVFHGYAEIWFNDRWIKVTPVFNKSLCEKLNVECLEFDGENDAVFQQYDKRGGRFMEYLRDYGTFDDVPYEKFRTELVRHYPHLESKILDEESLVIN